MQQSAVDLRFGKRLILNILLGSKDAMEIQKESDLLTAGGRIACRRCQAMSKRTRLQCAAPASQGKSVCRFHGGRSCGPKTEQGRQRCAEAMTVHGRETRAKRQHASELNSWLRVCAQILGVKHRSESLTGGSLKQTQPKIHSSS